MWQMINILIFIGFGSIVPASGMDIVPDSNKKAALNSRPILQKIEELSHPKFQGRQAGTLGGKRSAQYVAKQFQSLGLEPILQESPEQSIQPWFHSTPLTATHILTPALVALFSLQDQLSSPPSTLQIGKDYLPILDSPSVNLTAPLMFVGYGIHDPARGIDDYKDVNIHNQIVLFLRGKPPGYSRWITHQEKVQTAQEKGATAYLTVTGPLLNRYEARKGLGQTPLAIYSSTPETRPIPGAWLDGHSLEALLTSTQESLESWQKQANEDPGHVSRPLPLVGHLSWDTRQELGASINVLGLLPGEDPALRDEILLIGAHRDHFGEQAGLPFLGADDNASGTAVMLEVARQLIERRKSLKRSILFVSFDGEERGLLGSKQYIQHPAWPLRKTVAMINLDHVGVGNGKLTVGVTRLERSLAQQAGNQAGISENMNIYGYFPGGDHVPFYEKNIPTITIVSAGIHPHFHQPSDTAETMNPEILKTVTQFTMNLIEILSHSLLPIK